jgi:biopolymer transport protein TolR
MKTNRDRGVMSEINVTPFVDVMLVLLVIFMVTAPLMQQGIDVNLPQAKGKSLSHQEPISLVVRKNQTIYLNKTRYTLPELRKKLTALSKSNPDIFLKADRDVPYGFVVEVISEVKDAGIEKLGMITEPKLNIK